MDDEPIAASSDEELRDKFLRLVGRHLVVLEIEYESYDKGKLFHRGRSVLSGFVLGLDRFYWITAGHCFREIDVPIGSGTLKITRSGFRDHFGTDAVNSERIPFEYEVGCGFFIWDKYAGLDFGLIPLNNLTIEGFDRNGVRAVMRKNWEHQPRLTFEHYKLLGCPAHLVTSEGYQVALLAIDRLDPATVEDCPSGAFFVGRIPPDVAIPDLAGMSGGPIFGFRRNDLGQWTYHVVALQSSWNKKARVIYGCSLPYFAEELHRTIESQTGSGAD